MTKNQKTKDQKPKTKNQKTKKPKNQKKKTKTQKPKNQKTKNQKTKKPKTKQGGIHGSPVMDGWAGAVTQKPLTIQKYFGRTDGRADGLTNTATSRVAYPRLKKKKTEQDDEKEKHKEEQEKEKKAREKKKEKKEKKKKDRFPLCSTGLRPHWGRCPALPSTSIRARVPLTTHCLWAAIIP